MTKVDYQQYLITGTEIQNPSKPTISGLKGISLTNEAEGQTL